MAKAGGEWYGAEKIRLAFKLMDSKLRATSVSTMKLGMLQIAGRMKQIITENGHVITGNLRRSCTGDAKFVTPSVVEGTVKAGDTPSGVHYAPAVEALPDGGFFYRAIEEMTPLVEQGMLMKMRKALDQ